MIGKPEIGSNLFMNYFDGTGSVLLSTNRLLI